MEPYTFLQLSTQNLTCNMLRSSSLEMACFVFVAQRNAHADKQVINRKADLFTSFPHFSFSYLGHSARGRGPKTSFGISKVRRRPSVHLRGSCSHKPQCLVWPGILSIDQNCSLAFIDSDFYKMRKVFNKSLNKCCWVWQTKSLLATIRGL